MFSKIDFLWIVKSKERKYFNQFLKEHPDWRDVGIAHGKTTLMWVVMDGELWMMQELIDQGVDVNRQSGLGWTALIYACQRGKLEMVSELLKAGAQTNLEMKEGMTALIMAAKNGNIDILQLLIDNGADLNHQDSFGWTALMHASGLDRQDVVMTLIDRGAEMDLSSRGQEKAIDIARRLKNEAVVAILDAVMMEDRLKKVTVNLPAQKEKRL